MGVYAEREDPLNQGDIFADVPFLVPRGDDRTHEEAFPGLVISHDCDCDKFFSEREKGTPHDLKRWAVTMIPLYRVEDLQGGQAGDAAAGRIRRFFYIPEEGERVAMVGDFMLEQPVPVVQLIEGVRAREGCLSDEMVRRLHIAI